MLSLMITLFWCLPNEITQYAGQAGDVPGCWKATDRLAVLRHGQVTGTANVQRLEQTPIVRRTSFVDLWPSDVTTSVICLPMTEMEGSERQLTHA
jgi:hypothetical protein